METEDHSALLESYFGGGNAVADDEDEEDDKEMSDFRMRNLSGAADDSGPGDTSIFQQMVLV